MLRLEDVDAGRSTPELVEQCKLDLAWLGLDWDAIRLQSDGLERLNAAARALESQGLAYPCICSRGEIRRISEIEGAPHAGQLEPRYPLTCRDQFESIHAAERITGKEAGLRFRLAPEGITFRDHVFGLHTANPWEEVGDFLILRRNKTPCYQLAVVVDDAYDGVSEVVRGRDLLDSTARQIALHRALGLPPPNYAHLPLICDLNGRRLAKREQALGLDYLREHGIEPSGIIRWVASLIGIEGGRDLKSAVELAPHFRWNQVPTEDIRLPRDPVSLLRGFL